VTVRSATERTPRGLIFGLSNGPQRFASGREPVSDVPALAEPGVNQDEPKVRLIRVQRDTAGGPVRVVVGCANTQARVRLPITRSIGPRRHCSNAAVTMTSGLHTDRPARRQDCHGAGRRANPCLLAQRTCQIYQDPWPAVPAAKASYPEWCVRLMPYGST
jgi:hypothetical protein